MLLYFYALRPGQRFPEPDTHRMLVGAALQAARLEAGLSLVQVVDALADSARRASAPTTPFTTSTGSLSRHEAGRTPITLELFDALAIVFDVPPETLHRLIADTWLRSREEVETALKSARRRERLIEHFREQVKQSKVEGDGDGHASSQAPSAAPALVAGESESLYSPTTEPASVAREPALLPTPPMEQGPEENRPGAGIQSPWHGGPPTSTVGMLDDLQPGVSWTELLPLERDPTTELAELATAASMTGRWHVAMVGPTRRALDRIRAALADQLPGDAARSAAIELVSDLRAVRWLITEPPRRIGREPPSRLLLVDGAPTLVRLRLHARREGLEWPPAEAAVMTLLSPLDGGPRARCDLGRSPSKCVTDGFMSGHLAAFDAWLSEGPPPGEHRGFSVRSARGPAAGPLPPEEILRRIEDPRIPPVTGKTVVYCPSREEAEALHACLQARGLDATALHARGWDKALEEFVASADGWLCATRRLSRFDASPAVARIVLAVRTHPRSLPDRILPLLHASQGVGPVQIIELIEPGDRRTEAGWKSLARWAEDLCTWQVLPAEAGVGPLDAEWD